MAIILKERASALTAIVEPSDGRYVVFCPELDIATEGRTPEEAIDDLADMARDYAEQYMEDFHRYRKSPNRSAHAPFVKAIRKLGSREKIRALFA